MKTSLDIVDIIYGRLNPTISGDGIISGKVYKHKRPINSKLEDVVIGTLATINTDVQTAIINVNVHVQDLIIASNGAQESQANHLRLNQLAKYVMGMLDNKWLTNDYSFNIQQQTLFEDLEGKEHYINIRIEFFSINVLN